jgi:dihydroorotase
MEGLETLYSVLDHLQLDADRIVDLLSRNPRRIFNMPESVITEGAAADLTLFVPGTPLKYTAKDLRSRSKNNAFLEKELSGRVTGILHQSKLHLNA